MNDSSIDSDDYDRVAKLLVDSGQASSFEDAESLLHTYRLQLVIGPTACQQAGWQAAVLTAVNAGVRAVHGGVNIVLGRDETCQLPLGRGRPLSETLCRHGGKIADRIEAGVLTIVFGDAEAPGATGPVVHALAGQWTAGVSPTASVTSRQDRGPSTLAGAMAAAIAISECFQNLRGYSVAAERSACVSIWRPDLPCEDPRAEGPAISELPDGLWLLGLGHLGQAYAWLLGLLPYPCDGSRTLVLQDDDRLSKANRATSMLHTQEEVGIRKTRLADKAMASLGWDARLIEHRYLGGPIHAPGDPAILLAGVDNPNTRRLLDETGFPVVVDVGLGAGPDGFLGMSIRRLPGSRSAQEIWSVPTPASSQLPAGVADAYRALEEQSGDRCGVERLAGRTVASAFVGVTAACWAIGGLLRELHGGARYELVDHTLRDPAAITAITSQDARPPRVPTIPCGHST